MANSEVRIYLTHYQMIITDSLGFRFEINIPEVGRMQTVHINQNVFFLGHTCQVGHHPGAPLTPSPDLSPYTPQDSSSISTPSDGGSGNGNVAAGNDEAPGNEGASGNEGDPGNERDPGNGEMGNGGPENATQI